MIKCREALNGNLACKNEICCYECEEKETCQFACEFFGIDKSNAYKKCKYAIDEETSLIEFENKALSIIKAIADISKQGEKGA